MAILFASSALIALLALAGQHATAVASAQRDAHLAQGLAIHKNLTDNGTVAGGAGRAKRKTITDCRRFGTVRAAARIPAPAQGLRPRASRASPPPSAPSPSVLQAKAMGVWRQALADDPGWAEWYGTRSSGLKKEWGCPTPDKLEQWSGVCYGKCPEGYKRTFICSCRQVRQEVVVAPLGARANLAAEQPSAANATGAEDALRNASELVATLDLAALTALSNAVDD